MQTGLSGISVDSLDAVHYAKIGGELADRQQYDSSSTMYWKSVGYWDNTSHWKENVRCRLKIVVNKLNKGEFSAASQLLAAAEELVLKNNGRTTEEMGRVQTYKSFVYTSSERNVEGVKAAQDAIRCFENSVGTENVNTGWAYYTLCNALQRTGEYERSYDALVKARTVLLPLLDPNDFTLAKLHIALGGMYDMRNEYNDAIASQLSALKILEHHQREFSIDAGYCYLNLMSTYTNKGDYVEALHFGEKGLEVYKRLGQWHSTAVSAIYGIYGRAYLALGDYENAKLYLRRTLEHIETYTPNVKSPKGYVYRDLAMVFNKTNEPEKAIEYALKGIEILKTVFSEYHHQMGYIYELTAEIYADRKEYREALHYYADAVTARKNIGPALSMNDIAVIYSSIGSIYLAMGRNDSAQYYLQLAAETESASRQKNAFQQAQLLKRFGDMYRMRKEYDRSLVSYHHALLTLSGEPVNDNIHQVPPCEKSIYKKELLELLALKATVLEEQYRQTKNLAQLHNSYSHRKASLDVVDMLRREYSGDGSKILLSEKSGALYGEACRLAYLLLTATGDEAYREDCLLIADRSKANILLEKLIDTDAKHFAGIPDSVLTLEKDLLRQISYFDTQVQKFKERGAEGRDVAVVNEHRFNLRVQHQQLVDMIEQKYPDYYGLKYARPVHSLKNIQAAIEPSTTIVEYLVHGTDLYIFTISQNSFTMQRRNNAAAIAAAAGELTNALRRYDTEDFCRSANIVVAGVLKPLEGILRTAKNLIIIPDGSLFTVPFEALPMSTLSADRIDFTSINYLIKRFDVAYSYSASFYLAMESVRKGRPSTTRSFAGFAPVFRDSVKNGDFLANRSFVKESGLSDVRSITLDGKKFNELRYSEEEIGSIAQSFGGKSVPYRTFLHTDATETNFKRFSSKYDIVHIATHGFINEKNPKLSALLFSQPTISTMDDDGILYINETFNLELQADLVVLSSCESGVGKIVQGEGMMALTRGLFYAGAKNIIYSLWKVSDKQTYVLMDRFYEEVLSGKSYSSSLRNAKLAMIASQESAFPSKWSGFVLMGK